MTLLLGAFNTNVIVFGADGAEVHYGPNQQVLYTVPNQRKLLPIPGRAVALGIHGTNCFASRGTTHDEYWLVIDKLQGMVDGIYPRTTVEGLCRELACRLTGDVEHTFQLLASKDIRTGPMGLVVAGFDNNLPRPRCWEAWWPLEKPTEPSITDLLKDKGIPEVIPSGKGAKYAKTAISHGSRYSVDRLKKADLKKTQEYVRVLYRKSESLQPNGSIDFGGDYHEISVTPHGASWSVADAPNTSVNPSGGSGRS